MLLVIMESVSEFQLFTIQYCKYHTRNYRGQDVRCARKSL
jgi:hypothetical protein